jgi:riboflavin synthase
MFTGLITHLGILDRVAVTDAGREFRVRGGPAGLAPGDSIAVNGVCLTVREVEADAFTTAAVVTTLERTTLGRWAAGRRVNLERPLALGDRLGGHLVLGHVDAVAVVTGLRRRDDATLLDLECPAAVMPLVVDHGSIAIDGVSLTVNAVTDPATVQLSLIDYTLRHTTLGDLVPGDQVNVEADVLGKYIQRLAAPSLGAAASPPGAGAPDAPWRA